MRESESMKTAIMNRLHDLDTFTRQELEEVRQMTCAVCGASTALIALLDDDKLNLKYHIDGNEYTMPLNSVFCRLVILQDDMIEIGDTYTDERVRDSELVVRNEGTRFYVGVPLKTSSGEIIGTLCALDTQPKVLDENQKLMLRALSRQIISVFEHELSLKMLTQEIKKVQDSELKLKCVFQNSPTSHILIDLDMKVLTFNKAAADFIYKVNNTEIKEEEKITSFLSEQGKDLFEKYFMIAAGGRRVCIEQKFEYDSIGERWWSVSFNPAYNHKGEIIGVTCDSVDITERIKYRQNILSQNEALKEIAQIQSHDMRQPVANLVELTDLMNDCEDENFGKNLEYMKQEVHKLDERIHHIVEVSSNNNLFG